VCRPMPEWPVLVVVIVEETFAKIWWRPGGSEAIGKGGAVLEGFETGLTIRVVVRYVRTGMGAADHQVRQQASDGLGGHRAAPVGVDGERAGSMCWEATTSAIQALASWPSSWSTTIQPGQ